MNIPEMFLIAIENLSRTKLRTVLTTLGVVIGIGALTSMVSFGTGMQKNITDAIETNDLFTSLFVTAQKVDLAEQDPDQPVSAEIQRREESLPLNDSTLQVIQAIAGVAVAYPEINFPVKIRLNGEETRTTLRALPVTMNRYRPYDRINFGNFFSSDSSAEVIINWNTLRRLKVIVQDADTPVKVPASDSARGMKVASAASVLSDTLQIISAFLDVGQLSPLMINTFNPFRPMPIGESQVKFKICGIIKKTTPFIDPRMSAGILVPIRSAEKIPRLGFSSVWDLLARKGSRDQYSSLYVRLGSLDDLTPVRKKIDDLGLHTFSISDQLKEIRRSFLIVNGILGAVGTIALVVAALGIVNTMIMSILERTREIGIMKAIGGSEIQIKMIFMVEAGIIGLVGAVFGLLLGWVVTRIANLVANSQFLPAGEPSVDFFFFPIWLIVGAVFFSLVIALAAGLYPAVRAARVDPIKALRHE